MQVSGRMRLRHTIRKETAMKLKEAAKKVEDSVEETLSYTTFPFEHWTRIRTNNVIERLNREIRRRTRVVGTFPDGNSALIYGIFGGTAPANMKKASTRLYTPLLCCLVNWAEFADYCFHRYCCKYEMLAKADL